MPVRRIALHRIDQYCRSHPSPLGGKNIERPARRRRVHHFDADPRIGQRAGQAGMRKADGYAGAQQHHFGRERDEALQVLRGESREPDRRRGEDIIDFGIGNPDGPTPAHIVAKLVRHRL